jgi:putative DNA-invertase from lambdoid prophage Rac
LRSRGWANGRSSSPTADPDSRPRVDYFPGRGNRGSLVDLVTTLQELTSLQVGFVSLGEALDLTTPSGRALAGMLAVFVEFERDILRDRVKAGIAQARKEGRPHGRPQTIARHVAEVKTLYDQGVSKREIAKKLGISRTSVRRFLDQPPLSIP